MEPIEAEAAAVAPVQTDDFSSVVFTPDKPAGYNTGDVITLTGSGADIEKLVSSDTVTITVTSSDGATGTTTTTVVMTKVTSDTIKATKVVSALGVVYAIGATGLVLTATAP